MTEKYLQYVSDLHLEFYKKNIPSIEPINEHSYLALLGDIGYPFQENYEKFLSDHSLKFKEILLITGNHEYYSSRKKQHTMSDIESKIKGIIAKYPNITFLQNSAHTIGDTTFLGSTLWSDVQNIQDAQTNMNDYDNIYLDSDNVRHQPVYKHTPCSFGGQILRRIIKKNRSLLYPTDVNQLHSTAIAFIKNQLESQNKNTIILSHHAPSFQFIDSKIVPDCYASNLEYLMEYPHLDYWLFGHIHSNKTIDINYTISSFNCMGYKSELCENFDPQKHIKFT